MIRFFRALGYALVLAAALASGQQEHPDAPSASKPQTGSQLPDAPQPQQQPTFPTPSPTPQAPAQEEPAAPPARVTPAAPQQAPAPGGLMSSRDDLFKIGVTVNQVIIPVTVRDDDGYLVEGLLPKDFTVYEDGKAQSINFFTSDPFPLSAAVVLDLNLSDTEMKKVRATFGALTGAFSEFDEVAFYTYGRSVERKLEFSAMNERFSAALRRIKPLGQTGGVPVTTGPMAGGPTINGRPVDPGMPRVYTPPKESNVLNDAILAAARDLAKRERARRKIIFVISDGMESGSRATFDEVRKVLLSNEITVYGVAVDEGALPVYRSAQKIHIPGSSTYGNLLDRYAGITGGEIFPEIDRSAIETAYARLTSTARNQYTIGYRAKAATGGYRSIEVVVHRGGLNVKAKPGYFPLPPGS